jgi:hypothetical protein
VALGLPQHLCICILLSFLVLLPFLLLLLLLLLYTIFIANKTGALPTA